MTRKEKDLKLLEALGLKIGDKIKTQVYKNIYEIVERNDAIRVKDIRNSFNENSSIVLLMYDWQKVEPLLKDKKCKEIAYCDECPLRNHYCGAFFGGNLEEHTLEEVYNKLKEDLDKAKQEIYGEE